MGKIDRIVGWMDRITQWQWVLAFFVFILTGLIVYHVIARYALHAQTALAFDLEWFILAFLFSVPMGYALLHGTHIRIRILTRLFSPMWQELLMCISCLFFIVPVAIVLTIYGWDFAMDSVASGQKTVTSAELPVFPVKFSLALAGLLLLFQTLAELTRHVARLIGVIRG